MLPIQGDLQNVGIERRIFGRPAIRGDRQAKECTDCDKSPDYFPGHEYPPSSVAVEVSGGKELHCLAVVAGNSCIDETWHYGIQSHKKPLRKSDVDILLSLL